MSYSYSEEMSKIRCPKMHISYLTGILSGIVRWPTRIWFETETHLDGKPIPENIFRDGELWIGVKWAGSKLDFKDARPADLGSYIRIIHRGYSDALGIFEYIAFKGTIAEMYEHNECSPFRCIVRKDRDKDE